MDIIDQRQYNDLIEQYKAKLRSVQREVFIVKVAIILIILSILLYIVK